MKSHTTTIKQVADEAGVSVATVSKVMNGVPTVNKIIARHVRETVNRLGYQPNASARALSSKRTQTLGVLVYSITDPIISGVVLGIEQRARTLGYDILLLHDQGNEDDEQHLSRVLTGRRVDGMAIVGAQTYRGNDSVTAQFESSLPMLLVFRESVSKSVPAIHLNDYEGARIATAHLIQHGHRRIGLLASSDHRQLDHARMAGFLAALEEAGVPADKSLIDYGDWDAASGFEAMQRLLKRAKPTAVFAFNDRMAYGAMHAIRQTQLRIPEDIALVGFDNQTCLAEFMYPPLTTVAVDWHAVGARAANGLIDIINGDLKDDLLPVPTKLVIRQSCGCVL